MAKVIRYDEIDNCAIVNGSDGLLKRTYFNLITLDAGTTHMEKASGFELLVVVLSGNCDVEIDGQVFQGIGQRPDIWSGKADSVYAGPCNTLRIQANCDHTEIAIAGGLCDRPFAPFRIPPENVDMVDVGSLETHSRRRIYHILGNNHVDQAGNLLVSELYADAGCWSGYPPHKHDEDRDQAETAHEELYHFRFRPETGFGAQFCFQPDGSRECYMMCHGDTFLLDRGFHPTVTSPGHDEYIFTILVGNTQRPLVQYFHEDYHYLMNAIPGIDAMRAKFR